MTHALRICARIDLDAIRENVIKMHDLLPEDIAVIPVVKADAYGHGAVMSAKILTDLPYVKGYAVAMPDEAEELYEAGIRKPVLILGITLPDAVEEAVAHDYLLTVSSLEEAERISKEAEKQGKTAGIFFAADTGMGRIGFQPDARSLPEIRAIMELPGLRLSGAFSHFAEADAEDLAGAKEQLARFRFFLSLLAEEGIAVPCAMICNSAGLIRMPEAHMDAVRAGITMYGLAPSPETAVLFASQGLHFRPAMEIVSHITFVKDVAPGQKISYGGTYTADSPRRIATIPAGYADGYARTLSGKADVLIRGKRAPVRGRICMDQFMADVTEIPEARAGDEVILLGAMGEERITAEELGDLSGRFNYEFVSLITKRVPRVYMTKNLNMKE